MDPRSFIATAYQFHIIQTIVQPSNIRILENKVIIQKHLFLGCLASANGSMFEMLHLLSLDHFLFIAERTASPLLAVQTVIKSS